MQSYKYIVSGRVQGVYYRKNIAQNANNENFKGYVKNLKDGTVEACATFDSITKKERFEAILEVGSPNSIVENIQESKIDEMFSGEEFEIRYEN